MQAKDSLINFQGLVKNRLGPYKIVVKDNYSQFFYRVCGWTQSVSEMYDHSSSRCPIFNNATTYLTTAAGYIQLKKEDFKL